MTAVQLHNTQTLTTIYEPQNNLICHKLSHLVAAVAVVVVVKVVVRLSFLAAGTAPTPRQLSN